MRRRDPQRARKKLARPNLIEDHIALWLLRVLVRAGAARAYVTRNGELTPTGAHALTALGIAVPTGASEGAAALRLLRARLRELERAEIAPCAAGENARTLGALLGLTRAETAVLAFAIALETETLLYESFAELRVKTHAGLCNEIARALGLRNRAVERALRPEGRLRSVPVLAYARSDSAIDGPFELAETIKPLLLTPLASEQDALRHFLTRAPAAGLRSEDFPHLAVDVELLARYLRAALASRKPGVNVLLYGPPGTGKTQLARAIAAEIGAELYEVNLEDADQDVQIGSARLHAYALSQRFLNKRRNTLLLLDEVEDLFPGRLLQTGWRAGGALTKAWTNRLLEQNSIPAIWISNAIGQIDRAYVRRFDLVIEIGQPPSRVRRSLLERHFTGLRLSAAYMDRLASVEELSPAHVQRAASLVRLLRPADAARASADLDRVLRNNLRAYGGREPRGLHPRRAVPYEVGLLNLDLDAVALGAGLRAASRAALCFYGPPGTGKTAFARHLAREADREIHEYRASDLLDKYIGESEKRIAAMFERAARDSALLLLDEADGFLADRRGAHQSWELTLVNEMLVQMEQFEGLFICSTNLFERLDPASLRRFTLKVRFGYLTRDRARNLFDSTLELLGLPAAGPAQLGELDQLQVLTPGDFVAVARGAQLIGGLRDAADLLQALTRACAEKRVRGGRALGFGR